MAPHPGNTSDSALADEAAQPDDGQGREDGACSSSDARDMLAARASAPQNFTLRGVLVGLLFGVVICFSNVYFGLQTVRSCEPTGALDDTVH